MDLGKKRELENVPTNLGYSILERVAPACSGLAIRYKKYFCLNIYKTLT